MKKKKSVEITWIKCYARELRGKDCGLLFTTTGAIIYLRRITLNNQVHFRNIQSTCCHICCDQNLVLPVSETLQVIVQYLQRLSPNRLWSVANEQMRMRERQVAYNLTLPIVWCSPNAQRNYFAFTYDTYENKDTGCKDEEELMVPESLTCNTISRLSWGISPCITCVSCLIHVPTANSSASRFVSQNTIARPWFPEYTWRTSPIIEALSWYELLMARCCKNK